jgi:hypothetical protein
LQATIRLWLDDFHPAVGLLTLVDTLFAAICLGLAIAVRVLLLSYNISCFGHSSSVPRHYGRFCGCFIFHDSLLRRTHLTSSLLTSHPVSAIFRDDLFQLQQRALAALPRSPSWAAPAAPHPHARAAPHHHARAAPRRRDQAAAVAGGQAAASGRGAANVAALVNPRHAWTGMWTRKKPWCY